LFKKILEKYSRKVYKHGNKKLIKYQTYLYFINVQFHFFLYSWYLLFLMCAE
jgi:hypothetical protein